MSRHLREHYRQLNARRERIERRKARLPFMSAHQLTAYEKACRLQCMAGVPAEGRKALAEAIENLDVTDCLDHSLDQSASQGDARRMIAGVLNGVTNPDHPDFPK